MENVNWSEMLKVASANEAQYFAAKNLKETVLKLKEIYDNSDKKIKAYDNIMAKIESANGELGNLNEKLDSLKSEVAVKESMLSDIEIKVNEKKEYLVMGHKKEKARLEAEAGKLAVNFNKEHEQSKNVKARELRGLASEIEEAKTNLKNIKAEIEDTKLRMASV